MGNPFETREMIIGNCVHCGVAQFDNPDADPALDAMAHLCWKCVKPHGLIMPGTVQLPFAWAAYTSEHFDAVYDRHAAALGHRPSFAVNYGGDHAVVTTTEPDAARAIIAEVERLTADG